jgi:GNAT superfamily N-acetyltransferase
VDDPGRRALRVRAANAVDHTSSLVSRDPSWGGEVHAFAGGWLVLAGPGMYINQAMAAGIEAALTSADLDLLIERSDAVGVAPAIEVTPTTAPEGVRRIRWQGFTCDPNADIALLTRSTSTTSIDAPADVAIRPVRSAAGLRLWQETSATGWGHTSGDARRASDAFAAAASALGNEHMAIAVDPVDGRPLGCASMTVRDGVAMLGGMSTVPTERRRGVQAALLRHRLTRARALGCDLAMTTAARGGASARNLQRHGFTPRFTIQRFTRPMTPTSGGPQSNTLGS